MKWQIDDRVRVREQISGDDVPAGTCGTVEESRVDGTVCVRLDGEWPGTDEYWTNADNLDVAE